MSPISSRNSVPPSACSKRPRRMVCAPVKAPRSWPNSSLSSKSLGMAAVLMATNGPDARCECLCSARATNSLPVPDSPVIITVTLLWLRRPIARNTSCMAGAWPSISGVMSTLSPANSSRWLSSTARRINSTALGKSKGLGKYSNAPPWKAETALSKSEKAVMMMTGKPGRRSLTRVSNSSPEPPGMRMSLTSTCGPSSSVAASRACSTSRGLVKLRVGRLSRNNAFSSTKRMDWSSSTIQIGFMSVSHLRSSAVTLSTFQGKGIRILKSVRPGTLSHSIRPWCCCTKVCAKFNPRPDPPSRPDTSGKNSRSLIASGMPGPLSMTCNSNAKR